MPLAIAWSSFGAFLMGTKDNNSSIALSTAIALCVFVLIHIMIRAIRFCGKQSQPVLSDVEQQREDEERLLQKLSADLTTSDSEVFQPQEGYPTPSRFYSSSFISMGDDEREGEDEGPSDEDDEIRYIVAPNMHWA